MNASFFIQSQKLTAKIRKEKKEKKSCSLSLALCSFLSTCDIALHRSPSDVCLIFLSLDIHARFQIPVCTSLKSCTRRSFWTTTCFVARDHPLLFFPPCRFLTFLPFFLISHYLLKTTKMDLGSVSCSSLSFFHN